MHIQRVKIENFRCIERFEEEFSRYSNIFCGVNGSGKTTILQALESCLAGLLLVSIILKAMVQL